MNAHTRIADTTKPANILSHKAVLASVSISAWSARRLDKAESTKINSNAGAKADVGRVNKLLVNKERIDGIAKIASAARAEHYRITMPWLDEGSRILPNALFMEHATTMRNFERDFHAAAEKFCTDYPQMIEEAKTNRMGSLFKAEDYPSPSAIRNKFNFSKHVYPCPDAADFRVDLSQDQLDDLRRDVEERMQEALETAVRGPINRIIDTVGLMAQRLKEYQPSSKHFKASPLYQSMIDNIKDLVGLLPAFNIKNDPKLAAITTRMADELTLWTVDDFKEASSLSAPKAKANRTKAAKSAEEILAAAQALMA
jgi:hypothetical protein